MASLVGAMNAQQRRLHDLERELRHMYKMCDLDAEEKNALASHIQLSATKIRVLDGDLERILDRWRRCCLESVSTDTEPLNISKSCGALAPAAKATNPCSVKSPIAGYRLTRNESPRICEDQAVTTPIAGYRLTRNESPRICEDQAVSTSPQRSRNTESVGKPERFVSGSHESGKLSPRRAPQFVPGGSSNAPLGSAYTQSLGQLLERCESAGVSPRPLRFEFISGVSIGAPPGSLRPPSLIRSSSEEAPSRRAASSARFVSEPLLIRSSSAERQPPKACTRDDRAQAWTLLDLGNPRKSNKARAS